MEYLADMNVVRLFWEGCLEKIGKKKEEQFCYVIWVWSLITGLWNMNPSWGGSIQEARQHELSNSQWLYAG